MQNPPLNTLRGMPRHKRNYSPSPGFYNDFIEVRQIQTTKTMEGLYMIDQCYQIMLVSIICCYITNCHKLSSLKQHTFTISQFPGAGVWHGLNESFTQNIKKWQSRCQQGCILIWKPHWGRTLPRCTGIAVGSIHFLAAVRLRPHFYTYQLEATRSPLSLTHSPGRAQPGSLLLQGQQGSVSRQLRWSHAV